MPQIRETIKQISPIRIKRKWLANSTSGPRLLISGKMTLKANKIRGNLNLFILTIYQENVIVLLLRD